MCCETSVPYPELQTRGPGAAAIKPLPSRKSAVLGIEELQMPAPGGKGSLWIMKREVSQRLEMAVRARLPAWDAPTPLVYNAKRAYRGVSIMGETLPLIDIGWCDSLRFANALSTIEKLSPAYDAVLLAIPADQEGSCEQGGIPTGRYARQALNLVCLPFHHDRVSSLPFFCLLPSWGFGAALGIGAQGGT